MRRRHAAILLPVCLAACQGLRDFRSDGCSLFPDRSFLTGDDWCACCLEHDLAYWQGGTADQRLAADRALRDCVEHETGDPQLAEWVFRGVRVGGSPYLPTWFRWGYGWRDARAYRALSPHERRMVGEKLEEYRRANRPGPCRRDPGGR